MTFAIVGGNLGNAFLIDKYTAQIFVKTEDALDFETRGEWLLEVEATDSGEGNLTSIAKVKVRLKDVNERPALTGNTFEIEENSAVGTNVGIGLVVIDVDDGLYGECKFEIRHGDEDNLFKINKKSGQISIKRPFVNYETNSLYKLIVRVTDMD